jgi:hypothetical protein
MKTATIILSVCLAVLCVASGVLCFQAFQSKRDLQVARQKLKPELQNEQARAEALIAEKAELSRKLQVFQELTENLQSQLTDLTKGNSSEGSSEAKPPVVSPYQAQAYLGKTPIGWAWIVPHNLRKETNSQRYVYEPIIWLDEGMRKQFVTHHTNIVEREVEVPVSVNSVYYPEPGYYVSSPVYPVPPIHWPPGSSNRPPVPILPPTAIQPQPQQPFNPGSGAVAVQKLGTPAGAIKTRAVP